MLYFRIDLVNKKQYEESNIYKEIKITLPREKEELIKDFNYLELNYNNLSIQDTHIKECEVSCLDDPDFSKKITASINNLINSSNERGLTTTFQEIEDLNYKMMHLKSYDRCKLLAIIEAKDGYITDLKKLTKYVEHLDCFELEEDILSNEEYGRWAFEHGDVYTEDILDYIDFETFGNDYVEENNAVLTKEGMLVQLNNDLDFQVENEKEEEEEEFE